jgi:L-threonylcarbamoyladenylate synthase
VIITAGAPELLQELSRFLRGGGVAIIPCDTMYGIVGTAPGSEDRILQVKGRGEDKPFLQLIPDASWVSRVSDFSIPAALAGHWPGPLTIVIPAYASKTVALRVPDSPFLRDLISGLDRPIYSTSVNRAGNPPLWRIREIASEFERDVDLIVDAGDLPGSRPSTIVDATFRPFRVTRQGALEISPQELEQP